MWASRHRPFALLPTIFAPSTLTPAINNRFNLVQQRLYSTDKRRTASTTSRDTKAAFWGEERKSREDDERDGEPEHDNFRGTKERTGDRQKVGNIRNFKPFRDEQNEIRKEDYGQSRHRENNFAGRWERGNKYERDSNFGERRGGNEEGRRDRGNFEGRRNDRDNYAGRQWGRDNRTEGKQQEIDSRGSDFRSDNNRGDTRPNRSIEAKGQCILLICCFFVNT